MRNELEVVRQAIHEGDLQQEFIDELKQWPLLHFSNYAHAIQVGGFKYGESIVTCLDYTYKNPVGQREHTHSGYAFAFNAVAWNVENDTLDYLVASPDTLRNLVGMYAQSALLFAGNGLYTRHFDEFNQVICWGPSINVKNSLLLTEVGSQVVDGRPIQDENGNDVICWTLVDVKGTPLVSAEDHLTLVECVVKGIEYLANKRLLCREAITEANALYEEELAQLGIKLEITAPHDELCP